MKTRRTLAMLVALVMVLLVLPAPALADDVTYKVTFANNYGGVIGGVAYMPAPQIEVSANDPHTFRLTYDEPSAGGATAFIGWSTNPDNLWVHNGAANQYSPGDNITLNSSNNEITLYAVWGGVSRSLSYDGNANGVSNVPDKQRHYGDMRDFIVKPQVPVRDGYIFEGWSLNKNGSGTRYYAGDTIRFTIIPAMYHRTLYAQWSVAYDYKLTYVADEPAGTAGNMPAPNPVTAKTTSATHTFTVSGTKPTLTGYSFKGWATSSGGAVVYTGTGAEQISMSSPGNTEITLYGVWEITAAPQYTYSLVFDPNKPAAVADPVGNMPTSPSTYGPVTDLSYDFPIPNVTPTLSGYDFVGWATAADAVVADYVIGGNPVPLTSVANSATLYAVWAVKQPTLYTYTLTYNDLGNAPAGAIVNGAGPEDETEANTLLDSHVFTIGDDEPTLAGYSFTGWHDGTTLHQPGGTVTATSTNPDIVLTAVWAELHTYSLTYNGNEPAGTAINMPTNPQDAVVTTVEYDFPLSNTVPFLAGYNFVGWVLDPNDPNATIYPASDLVTVEATIANPDITLYAKWDALPSTTYWVLYLGNGAGSVGVPGLQSGTSATGSYTFTLNSKIPVRDGYTFEGWATSSGGSVAYLPGGQLVLTENSPFIILYAVWSGSGGGNNETGWQPTAGVNIITPPSDGDGGGEEIPLSPPQTGAQDGIFGYILLFAGVAMAAGFAVILKKRRQN